MALFGFCNLAWDSGRNAALFAKAGKRSNIIAAALVILDQPTNISALTGLLLRNLKASYYRKETLIFTLYPYSGDLV